MDADTFFGGASIFYLVPILIFGPLMFLVLWTFGLRDLFHRSDSEIKQRQQEQAQREQQARRQVFSSTV